MNIAISPELVPFVDSLVASGNFPSRDAAVCDALQKLRDRQARFAEFKASIVEGQEELLRGEGIPFEIDEILAEARQLHAQNHGS